MTQIELKNLRKVFSDTAAVDGIDLEIQEGEFVVLVGPSGCGKSTTLRLIAGLETATSGEIRMGDRKVNDLEPKDRNVSMVFQNYALYPHMTARRNITFGMKSAGSFSDEEINSRLEETTEMLDIDDLLDRKPAELSGGEKQRVALGRSLVRDPDVLLLDEPLANLDAKLRVQMRAELSELHSEIQTTTVYVTHDQVEAMTLGDRVAVMNQGTIQQVDPPQVLYNNPQHQFIAEFIGSPPMNTLPVTVSEKEEQLYAKWGNSAIRIPGTRESGKTTKQKATLGIRPENIHVAEGSDDFTFEFEVRVTELLGDSVLVHGTSGGSELTVQLDPNSNIEEHSRTTLRCNPDRIHLFDNQSGNAIFKSEKRRSQQIQI